MASQRLGDYVSVKVSDVGFADENGLEGMLRLKANNNKSFAMRSFSGEVAMHISRFVHGDRSSIPSIFNIVEELAEKSGVHLACVEIYPSGSVLRSDLYFVGREGDSVLRGFRASDGIALGLFYDSPIMLHHSLLESERTRPSGQK
jgi:bifunctional DNase/RNase